MRIATKLTLLLIAAVVAVMVAFGYLRAQQERQHLITELQQETLLLANAIKLTVEHAFRDRNPQDIRDLLVAMVREPNPVDRIRIFDRQLEDIYSADSAVAAATLVPPADLEQVLRTEQPIVRYLDTPRRPTAYVILPLTTRRGAVIGVLEVVHVATRVRRQIRDAVRDNVIRLTLLSATIGLVIWLTVRVSIRRPLSHLVRTALAFGHGDLDRRIGLRRRDEIGQLAGAFNRMAEKLQATQARLVAEGQARLALEWQVQQAHKLAAVGRLASEVAHEIGTPLNIISGRAEVVQRLLAAGHPLARHMATIVQQIERITRIIRQLLEYTRPHQPQVRPTPAGPMLTRALELLALPAQQRQVTLQAELPADLPPLAADPDQFQQVLLNLLTNALHATPAGGRITVAAREERSPAPDARPSQERGRVEGTCLTLTVEDSGAGMTTEELERIFEPFYSTKGRGLGTGLGMSIVQDIVQAHRAAIRIHSAKEAGTTVRLSWPIADRAPGAAPGGDVTPHGIPEETDAGSGKPGGPTPMSLAVRAAGNSG
jgi:two-component system, NtrC family, sensor histidine kinase HydH